MSLQQASLTGFRISTLVMKTAITMARACFSACCTIPLPPTGSIWPAEPAWMGKRRPTTSSVRQTQCSIPERVVQRGACEQIDTLLDRALDRFLSDSPSARSSTFHQRKMRVCVHAKLSCSKLDGFWWSEGDDAARCSLSGRIANVDQVRSLPPPQRMRAYFFNLKPSECCIIN